MTKRITVMALFWLLTASLLCGQQSVVASLDALIGQAFALNATPGMSVAVVHNKEVVYRRNFGYADTELKLPVTDSTLFYIASSTKSLTALAAALLEWRNKLKLDVPISRYLPNLVLQPPLSASSISVRELLTHTHGISNNGPIVIRTAYSGDYTRDQLIELLRYHAASPSGKSFEYGNIGYNVTGLILEEVEGKSWKEVVEQEVLQPAGMSSTSSYVSRANRHHLAVPYAIQEYGFRKLPYGKTDTTMHAAGGHVSTASDLARWLILHLNKGGIDGKQIFPAGIITETHRKQADQNRQVSNFHRYGWGLGWDLATYDGDTLMSRFGGYSGFRCHLSFMPHRNVGIIVLVNEGSGGAMLADLVACCIYDVLLQKKGATEKWQTSFKNFEDEINKARKRLAEEKHKRQERQAPLPLALRAYTGTYHSVEYGTIIVTAVNNTLQATFGALHSISEVFNAAQHQIRVELLDGGQVITFNVNGDRVKSLTFIGNTFEKTRD